MIRKKMTPRHSAFCSKNRLDFLDSISGSMSFPRPYKYFHDRISSQRWLKANAKCWAWYFDWKLWNNRLQTYDFDIFKTECIRKLQFYHNLISVIQEYITMKTSWTWENRQNFVNGEKPAWKPELNPLWKQYDFDSRCGSPYSVNF